MKNNLKYIFCFIICCVFAVSVFGVCSFSSFASDDVPAFSGLKESFIDVNGVTYRVVVKRSGYGGNPNVTCYYVTDPSDSDYLKNLGGYYTSDGYGLSGNGLSSLGSILYYFDTDSYTSYSASGNFRWYNFEGTSDTWFVYLFGDSDTFVDYVTGKTDAESAENYDDMNPGTDWLRQYDSSVPTVSYLKVSSINSSSARIEAGFDDFSVVHDYFMDNGLSYELHIYPLYCTQFGMSYLSKWSVTDFARSFDKAMYELLGVNYSTWSQNHLMNSNDISNNMLDIQKLSHVPSNWLGSALSAADGFMCYDDPVTFSESCDGTSNIVKTVSFTDHGDYVFCGCWCRIRTFSGNKTSGWTYIQAFNNDHLKHLLAMNSNYSDKVDDLGEKYIDSNHNNSVVNPSSVFDSVDLQNPDLTNYVKTGYGLLGSDGYIQLSQQFLLGIPNYIWVLIAFALSVNIIVIVFKALRGM